MRITKEKTAENRAALVQAAARLFRKHGIDGVGVAEISKAAGLTHGALYAHFPSKEALAAEALSHGMAHGYKAMASSKAGRELTLAEYLEFYLSAAHRDNPAVGCAIAASASELGRQDAAISARLTEGFERLVGTIERALQDLPSRGQARQRAVTAVAAMVGGIAMARATQKANPALSDEILVAVRRVLGELGGESVEPKPAPAASGAGRRKKP